MRALVGSVALALLGISRLAHAEVVSVNDVTKLRAALAAAKPGDEIVLANGTYAVSGANLACTANGTPATPIIVRAATPLGAKLELATLEGFTVSGASWHFEGLDVKGVCATDESCEHAFHVSGGATDFNLRKSRIVDFNAQLKVNASAGGAQIPHAGIVEGNEVFDSHPRDTSTPVTKLNIDTGDGWIVRANYIHDYRRVDGNPTYGAFMKSGGKNGLFERNLVLCQKDLAAGGVEIGLSFGGGGTAPEFCAPGFNAGVPCAVEHENGVMKNNIIAQCNDVGIYLNRAKNTKVLYNTLVGTSGVDYRFDTTSGEARGNVLTGKIRDRDTATHVASDNVENVAQATFDAMYVAPLMGNLQKKGDLAVLLGKGPASPDVTDDYCLRKRTGSWDLGALQSSLGDCTTTLPPLGDGTTAPAADGGASTSGGATTSGGASSGSTNDGGATTSGGAAAPGGGAGADDGCSTTSRAPLAPVALTTLGLLALLSRRGSRAAVRRGSR